MAFSSHAAVRGPFHAHPGATCPKRAVPCAIPPRHDGIQIVSAYDANNRLTHWCGIALGYDDNGNLISAGSTTYTWNARNQLAATSQGAASYAYDAAGRRRSRTVSGVSLQTLHDGWNPIQLKQSGSAVDTRLYGAGLDEIYGRTNSGASQSTLTDALGSVLQLANADQSAQADYTYGAYGQTTETPPEASSNLIRYTGREQDTAGLYYYRNRYYSPVTSRFLSEDPIGLAGGENLYSYVDGDPIGFVDPMGNQASFWRNPMFDEVWRNLAPDQSGKKPQPFDWQTACWKATCRDCMGNLFEIDYLDNSKGLIRDPGKLWPPSPSNVPDNCWCTKSVVRAVGGPSIPPGL